MTKVGVAVPWISGFCTHAIAAYMWARPIPGRCPRMMAITDLSSRKVCVLSKLYYLVYGSQPHFSSFLGMRGAMRFSSLGQRLSSSSFYSRKREQVHQAIKQQRTTPAVKNGVC